MACVAELVGSHIQVVVVVAHVRLVAKAGSAKVGIKLVQRKPMCSVKHSNIIKRVIYCAKGCTADIGKEEGFGLSIVETTRIAKGVRIAKQAGLTDYGAQ